MGNKYEAEKKECTFCRSTSTLKEMKGKYVCEHCLKELSEEKKKEE